MNQVPLFISAITLVSAIAQLHLFLFTESATPLSIVLLLGRFSYQLPMSGPSISTFIVSATPQVTSVIYLLEVIVPCTCVMSLITFWYQLLLSLTEVCFPNKIPVSGIPITYSSVTTKFLHSLFPTYQLLLSSITVCLLHSSCSDYSLKVLLSAIFISYSFLLHQLLVSSTRNRQPLLLLTVSATLYCISYSY